MDAYFKPKKFELYRNKTIYEFVGIKVYKKYLPTTGDIVRKWRNIVQIRPDRSKRISELYRYERQTRTYEIRHIIGTIVFVALVFVVDKKLNLFDMAFLTALNLYVNIYPIILQRHNRIRVIKVLLKNGEQSPYEK
jgi:glycosyl-4,4'-diaponeurosporenoate acyltransferase